LKNYKKNRIHVLGYVFTSWCDLVKGSDTRRAKIEKKKKLAYTSIKQDVLNWYSYYPRINGIFFDETYNQDNSGCQNALREATDIVRSKKGFSMGNPGKLTSRAYADIFDNQVIWQNAEYPSANDINEPWKSSRQKNSMIVNNKNPLQDQLLDACGTFQWIYTTTFEDHQKISNDEIIKLGGYASTLTYDPTSKTCSYPSWWGSVVDYRSSSIQNTEEV